MCPIVIRRPTRIGDVLALHRFEPRAGAGPEGGDGFDTSAVAPDAPDVAQTLGGVLRGPELERDFANLYRYYRDAPADPAGQNPTLAPLATRDLGDVYQIIRMARGEPARLSTR